MIMTSLFFRLHPRIQFTSSIKAGLFVLSLLFSEFSFSFGLYENFVAVDDTVVGSKEGENLPVSLFYCMITTVFYQYCELAII